MVVLKILD